MVRVLLGARPRVSRRYWTRICDLRLGRPGILTWRLPVFGSRSTRPITAWAERPSVALVLLTHMGSEHRVCRGSLVRIDPRLCNMCGNCVDACPETAVVQIANLACARCIKYCVALTVPCRPYELSIETSRCTDCGICVEVCAEAAIRGARLIGSLPA